MFNRTPKILQSLSVMIYYLLFYLETYGVPINPLFVKALKNFEGFALFYLTKVTLRSEGQSI
jgi:hypothetical protein